MGDNNPETSPGADGSKRKQAKSRIKSGVSFIQEATNIEHELRSIAERRAKTIATHQKHLTRYAEEEAELLRGASAAALDVLKTGRVIDADRKVIIQQADAEEKTDVDASGAP